MPFSIRIKRSALQEIARVAKVHRERIVAAIDELAEHPYLGSALKGERRGLRRRRVGDYRIVYAVTERADAAG